MDRKAAIRKYKETPPPIGVVCVRNTTGAKVLVERSVNAPAMLNRMRFQLEHGSHPNRSLQADWNELGEAAFTFEVLDTLEPSKEPACDPADDLKTLESMWREKLLRQGFHSY